MLNPRRRSGSDAGARPDTRTRQRHQPGPGAAGIPLRRRGHPGRRRHAQPAPDRAAPDRAARDRAARDGTGPARREHRRPAGRARAPADLPVRPPVRHHAHGLQPAVGRLPRVHPGGQERPPDPGRRAAGARRGPAHHRARRRSLLRELLVREPRRRHHRHERDAGRAPGPGRPGVRAGRGHPLERVRDAAAGLQPDPARRFVLFRWGGRPHRRRRVRAPVQAARPDRGLPGRRGRGLRRPARPGPAGPGQEGRSGDRAAAVGPHRRRRGQLRHRHRVLLRPAAAAARPGPAGHHHLAVVRPDRPGLRHAAAQLRAFHGRAQLAGAALSRACFPCSSSSTSRRARSR